MGKLCPFSKPALGWFTPLSNSSHRGLWSERAPKKQGWLLHCSVSRWNKQFIFWESRCFLRDISVEKSFLALNHFDPDFTLELWHSVLSSDSAWSFPANEALPEEVLHKLSPIWLPLVTKQKCSQGLQGPWISHFLHLPQTRVKKLQPVIWNQLSFLYSLTLIQALLKLIYYSQE